MDMNENQFTEMFFQVIKQWDLYATQVIRNKVLLNKRYTKNLYKRCKKESEKYCISFHDSLYSVLRNGEIQKVTANYIKTNKDEKGTFTKAGIRIN